jgi:hypothetical protein
VPPIAQRDSAAYFDNRIAPLVEQHVALLSLAPAVAEMPHAGYSASIAAQEFDLASKHGGGR